MAAVTASRRRGLGVLVCALVVSSWAPADAQRHSEYQVKAAYLQSFATFVEWPPTPSTQTSFGLCVLGDDPFGAWIDEAAAGTLVNNVPVVVRRLRQFDDSAQCQTLFISASEAERLTVILDALRTSPVLTVGDLPQFAQRGGMIGFTTDGGRVRFIANPGAAKNAGLQLRSGLLSVASSVLGRPTPPE